jgi:ribosomal-protein-alanine N-acetyltransferase
MAFFRLSAAHEIGPVVRGDGVVLRVPEMRDFEAWARLREKSRAFLTPWEPTWPADDLRRYAFRARIRRYGDEIARDEAYPFLIFRQDDDVLLGGLTLGHIRRGVAQSATLGYWIGASFAGQGYMTRAARAVTAFAFSQLRLHRIEAACLSQNIASARLLGRCGFQREGYARSYLRINGTWQDHMLFALLESDNAPEKS